MNDLQYQLIDDNDNDKCSVFEGASEINFVFLVLITLGIIVSYLPQYRRICIKKTSEGLSTNFLFLGSCSSIFTLTNIILVSSKARHCCYIGALNFFNCLNSQLNLIQIGIQCTCAILILVFVLVETRYSIKQDKEEYAKIVIVGNFVALHGVLSIIEVFIGLISSHTILITIAQINGILSALLTMMKYVPQIITTYRLKHPGTLSIGMMCIQTPGGLIFTMTLFFTKGSHWSSWVSYLVAALLQGTLLLLCIYYEYIKNEGLTAEISERREVDRNIRHNLDDTHDDAQETDVLIRS